MHLIRIRFEAGNVTRIYGAISALVGRLDYPLLLSSLRLHDAPAQSGVNLRS